MQSEIKKFCPSCQRERPAEGFKLMPTSAKGHRRWKCGICLNREATSLYKSKAKDERNKS